MIATNTQIIVIDDEFQSLIPPLGDDELAGLEQSIKAEGCRDSLVVWNGILLDGHNRYAICKKHKIEFAVVAIECIDHDAAKIWIVKNQFRSCPKITHRILSCLVRACNSNRRGTCLG